MGNDVPAEPLLFLKPPSSVIGGGEAIMLPADAGRVDFEGEIGVVVGEILRRATEEEASRAIRGIVAANDVSARDWQKEDGQWARAKGSDTFLPLGREAPAPRDLSTLEVVTRHNGVERQRASAGEMAFPIPFLLAYVSRYITLEPGDVLLTGTPAGVAQLAPGDTVEVEVAGLSRVSNPVMAGG